MIVALLTLGKRVGVSSNSHKAINNLLAKVEAVAKEEGFGFRGAKKVNGKEDTRLDGTFIEDVDGERGRGGRRFPARRRNGVALLAPRVRPGVRLSLRRRGGPGRRREPGRDGHERPQPRPARRSDAARAAGAGRPPGAVGRLEPRVPARRDGHDPRRPGRLPRPDVADAPGRLPVHLGGRVRRAAASRAEQREPAARAENGRGPGAAADGRQVRPGGARRVHPAQRRGGGAGRSALPESRSASATSIGTARSTRWGRRTCSSSRRTTRR